MFSGSVATRLLEFAANPAPGRVPASVGLTDREHQILDMLANGFTNTEIGRRLAFRPRTVRSHVSNVLTKIQVADRAEAVLRARAAGLGPDQPF